MQNGKNTIQFNVPEQNRVFELEIFYENYGTEYNLNVKRVKKVLVLSNLRAQVEILSAGGKNVLVFSDKNRYIENNALNSQLVSEIKGKQVGFFYITDILNSVMLPLLN